MNNNGIKIVSDETGLLVNKFYQWNHINNVKVFFSTKTHRYYLSFSHHGGEEKISLYHLAINPDNLEKLVKIYSGN